MEASTGGEERVGGTSLLSGVPPRAPGLPSNTQAFLGSHLLPCAWGQIPDGPTGWQAPALKTRPVLPCLSQGIYSTFLLIKCPLALQDQEATTQSEGGGCRNDCGGDRLAVGLSWEREAGGGRRDISLS